MLESAKLEQGVFKNELGREKTEAEKEAKSGTVHHKLRYIAGGVLIVIIIIVVGVLFWDRKRKMAAE